jgi:lipopolysaccharide transport system permease protein
MFSALWNYRAFILASVRREFDARYRVALLGGVWAILNPLAQIAVYTAVLAGVMGAKLPGVAGTFAYSIYLCAGIITWGLFAEIITRSTGVFVENANLLKKLNFPRICLPAIVVVSASLNFAIVFGLFLIFLVFSNSLLGWSLLGILPVFAIQIVLAAGLGVLLGVANVFYRDVAQGVGIFMQFWFWLTPIIYPLAIVPAAFQPVIRANPTTALAVAYQDILLANRLPDWLSLVPAAIVAVLAGICGMLFFRRRAGEMVDEL